MTVDVTPHPTPAFFFSHGSTMMLGEDSVVGDFWASVGTEAKRRGVKGIVFMGAHWEVTGDAFEVRLAWFTMLTERLPPTPPSP
jgi:aromatic ring-opening dioxygenase catalytic subunit (LigB family)